MEQHTPKQFVLQLGSLVSLYLSLTFLLVLLFGVINILLPDVSVEDYWQRSQSQEMVRFGLAMVIVFFPTYLILTRLVNKARRTNPSGAYLSLTKWLIYLSLLIGGGVLLGDLVAVINAYLYGEITSRFILKAGAVLLVVGVAFFYYLRDAQGYWTEKEIYSKRFGLITSTLVLLAVVTGGIIIDSPKVVREGKLDETQIRDLQDIQWRIQDTLNIGGELPLTYEEMYGGIKPPQAPAGRPAYRYELTETGFMLCATFSTEVSRSEQESYAYLEPISTKTQSQIIINADNWEHGTGEHCFVRKVVQTSMDNSDNSVAPAQNSPAGSF